MKKGTILWDSLESPPVDYGTLVLWTAISVDNQKSPVVISKLVEENAVILRSRYLAWIYNLAESKIDRKRVVDHLKMHSGLSYWWLTQLSEKQNINLSPQIRDVLQLMAFDMWAENRSIETLTLYSNNRSLSECLTRWCESRNIPFKWLKDKPGAVLQSPLSQIYRLLPFSVQALGYLGKYLYQNWCLRGVGLDAWKKSKGKLTFFSYLLNLDPKASEVGRFKSGYWGDLPSELQGQEVETNWLHRYVDHSLVSSPAQAKVLIESFNNLKNSAQNHTILESFLSYKVIFKALSSWIKLNFITRGFDGHLSTIESQGLWFWPLVSNDWRVSIYGSRAIMTLVTDELMRSALGHLPSQSLGIYLYEQQPWELSLIHAWKGKGHKALIASQHATMLFWDLRYYHDYRDYLSNRINSLPLPDYLAVNGPVTKKRCLDSGYPSSKLVDVEALRYQMSTTYQKVNHRKHWRNGAAIRLLVLTDYSSKDTQSQLLQLENSLQYFCEPISILVKPHPNCMVYTNDYEMLDFEVTMEPISELLDFCDVVFCSAVTSAAVEVYGAGVPLVSVKSSNYLNLSPLRGINNALFASTPYELHKQIIVALETPIIKNKEEEFFTIDSTLSRWKNLIHKCLTDDVIG